MSWDDLKRLGFDVGRTRKPRASGLTIALDVGLGPRGAADLVAVCAEHLDYVKIAWGSSLITGALAEKIDVFRAGGVTPLLGGTLFEYAYLYGRVEDLLAFVRETHVHIEISDGTLDIPHADKLRWLEKFAAHAEVFSEVGGKIVRHNRDWGPVIQAERAAGATKIVVEGREVGPVGEAIREDLIDDLVRVAGGHEDLIWESLERKQQLFFIKKLGVNVNLANIRPEDVLTLESFRRGLKEHTLLHTFEKTR